ARSGTQGGAKFACAPLRSARRFQRRADGKPKRPGSGGSRAQPAERTSARNAQSGRRCVRAANRNARAGGPGYVAARFIVAASGACLVGRSEEHTSELQSLAYIVCCLLLV